MPSKKEKIIIMGAGLAGLASAYELAKAGKNVTVIEKWEEVGGLARTISKKGFIFDTGPHRWFTKADFVNGWMLKLLDKEVIKVPRLTRIYFDGKFFYYPIKIFNALKGIGLVNSLRAVIDYLSARINTRLFRQKLYTMEDGYISQFGKTLYEIFFKRYSEKLWGVDCNQISVDWVGQRTRGLSIFTVIKESFFKSRNVVSFVDEFSYPKKGVGRIAQKMADYVISKGGHVYLNSEVTEVRTKNNKITAVILKKKNKNMRVISGNKFISSIPLSDLIKRLKNTPSDVVKIAQRLKYRDELQVVLFVKKTHITPDTWIYIHPKEIPFMRLMEMDNWSKGLSPKGTTSLVFEIACNEGDSMWKKSDKEIISLVSKSYIDEFRLIEHKDILGGYVHRVPKEYPVYHLDYKKDTGKLKAFLKKYTNLQIIGRNGTFRYNNMDHSIEMGLYAAWNIIKGKNIHSIESVNIEREYLEEKKLENIEDETLENEK